MALHLPIEQAIYVPSTNASQQKISSSAMTKRVETVKKFLADLYGGYSSMKEQGGFTLDNGSLVQEDIVKVTAFAKKTDYARHKKTLRKRIGRWKKAWGQESIGYELEGDLYYY